MADDFLDSLPAAPQQTDDWNFDSLPAAPQAQQPSLWDKAKNDVEDIVGGWWNGFKQNWNEQGRARENEVNVLSNPDSNYQDVTNAENYVGKSNALMANSLGVVPQIGMADFALNGVETGLQDGPLAGARAVTYGPLYDKLSQPDLSKQFNDHPVETGGEIILDTLPLVGAAALGRRGVKAGIDYTKDAVNLKPLEDTIPDAVDSTANIGGLEDSLPDYDSMLSKAREINYGTGDLGGLEDTLPNVPETSVSGRSGGNFDSFMDGVSGQESGGNYSARNSDTGAYGKFQIMPENWDSWRDEAANAGVDVGSGEMSDPAAQEAVARFKMKQYYDEYGPDGALVAWYAGPGNAARWAAGDATDVWGRPWDSEQSNGPSIKSYVDSAMNHAAESGYKDNGVRGESIGTDSYNEQPFDIDTSNERARESFNNQDADVFGDKMNDSEDISDTKNQTNTDENIAPDQTKIADTRWNDNINNDLMEKAHEAADSGDYQTAMQLAYKAGDNNWGEAYNRMRDWSAKQEQMQADTNNVIDNLHNQIVPEQFRQTPEQIKPVETSQPEIAKGANTILDVLDKGVKEITPDNVDLMRTPVGQGAMRVLSDAYKEMSKSNEDTYFDAALNGDYAKAAEMARQAGANDFADAFQKLADTNGGTVPPIPRLNDVNTKPYSGDTITMRQILNRAQQLFVPIRTGRIGMRDVEGFANHNTGVIRMRNYGDIGVLSHELGHVTDAALGLRSESGAFDGEFGRVIKNRFGNAYEPSQVRAEGIAEFMHDYLTNEPRAKQEFPRYYDAFKDKLSQNPDVQGRVDELKSMIDTWQKQSPEARARSSVAYQKDIEPSRMQKLKDAYNKFTEAIVDDKDPIKRATESYEKITGQKLETQDNPYKMARLAQNSATARAQMLIEGDNPELVKNSLNKNYGGIIDNAVTLKSILKTLDQTVKGKYDDYLKQGGFDNWHEALDSLLLARRQAEIQRIYPDYKGPLNSTDAASIIKNAPAELTRAAKQVYAYNDNILKIMRYTGMIKPEIYDALTKKYQNYVPMARDFSDEAGIIKGFGMAGKGYGNIRNIMKSLSEEGSTRSVISPLESITKNTYALLNLAERNKVGQIFARLSEGDRVGSIVERVKGAAAQKDSTFSVWVNGEKQVYQTTPEIYKAIMSMNQESAGIIAKLLSPPAQLLRAGATLMPDFSLKNVLRDTFGAVVFSRYGFRPVIDHAAAIMHMVKQDQMFQDYKSSGALMSTMVGLDRDFVQASLKGLYKKDASYYWKHYNPVQILRGFSEMLETATRLGEYGRAINKGASMEDAALSARDISLDFSKAGSWGRPYNKITAFFNAGVQEPARILQAFKENPKGTAAKTMLAITLPSVALWTMNHDKDWYKELPMWQKNIFWVFKAGDTIYRVPKPFGLGVLFGSLPERTLDWLVDKRPDAMKQWAKSAYDAFMPNIMPTAIGPIIENMVNYSFFKGRNIVPEREQKLPDAQQYGSNTSELAKSIGNMFGLSPRKIDNIIQGYGAGMATQTLNAIDYANGKRDMQNPFAKAFTVDPMKSPQSIQDFYDRLDDSEKTYNGAKASKSRLNNDDLYNYRLMDFANKKMQFLNKRERMAVENKDDNSISRINEQQLKVAQDALKLYRNK